MTDELKNTIKEQIGNLPKEGQEAIAAVDWVKITEEIGKEHSLLEEELANFQIETLLVLVGVTAPEFYAINIENQVDITTEQAEQLAKEGFEKIFTPIKNILEENIKRNLEKKNPNYKQSLDFILSGGDYGAFVENPPEISPTSTNT